ncbi:hypothetical protein QN224_15890 [Sinorhizobium sp. 8-89]|uniref:hypothetical protein n=1 Tax=Sinorhizobium sp. 7-81 TaxID=3049087 RepID=UPI0024C24EA6|nr:hypothetical protein [Sinorhizobium sp. 7-81]MDK1386891.1 hypothetical protein [Sinorhizobium sp. 7-81]
MADTVWVSSVMSDYSIGNRQGIREKFYGEDWAPPTFQLGVEPNHVVQAHRRHSAGEALERTDFPEAMYVFAENNWKRVGDLFCAGPFYAVKGRLADVLKEFDLGKGGLLEFPIYEADKKTRLPGPFYLLNFGAVKDSFVPSETRSKLFPRRTVERDGYELWATYDLEGGDIALTAAAFEGADLWHERKLQRLLFMSGRLHEAILAAKVKVKFRFARVRIVGEAAAR